MAEYSVVRLAVSGTLYITFPSPAPGNMVSLSLSPYSRLHLLLSIWFSPQLVLITKLYYTRDLHPHPSWYHPKETANHPSRIKNPATTSNSYGSAVAVAFKGPWTTKRRDTVRTSIVITRDASIVVLSGCNDWSMSLCCREEKV